MTSAGLLLSCLAVASCGAPGSADPLGPAEALPGSVATLAKGGGGKGGGSSDPANVLITFPILTAGGGANQLLDDGAGPYEGGGCGVLAYRDERSVKFRPVDPNLKGKALRRASAECTAYPRTWAIGIDGETLVHDPGDPTHGSDVRLSQLVAQGLVDDPTGRTTSQRSIEVKDLDTELPPTGDGFTRGNLNLPYCLGDDGVGSPLLFNAATDPITDDLSVSEIEGLLSVSTRAAPENVGRCTHDPVDPDGPEVVLYLHLDVAYDVVPLG